MSPIYETGLDPHPFKKLSPLEFVDT